MDISYVTGNKNKYENARKFFEQYNINVIQQSLSIPEIQGSDSIEIAIKKAEEAWKQLDRPLFINDATWIIPALKGFPGPYMKYINQWFEPIDFVHLMQGKSDRSIILKDVIVYFDDRGPTVFTNEHSGTVLESVAPGAYRNPSDAVISLSKTGTSVLEETTKGMFFIEDEDKVWKEFATWLEKTNPA